MKLTTAGELLVRDASEMLNLWNQADEEIWALPENLGERCGLVRSPLRNNLPLLFVRFTKARTDVKLQFWICNRDEIVRMLKTNEIEFAVV